MTDLQAKQNLLIARMLPGCLLLTLENKVNISCAMLTYSLFRFNWETNIQEGVKPVENKAAN